MDQLEGFIESLITVLTIIYNEVLTPVLTDTLMIYVEYISRIVIAFFSFSLYELLLFLCGILDSLEQILNAFSGVDNVLVNGEPMGMMEAIFQLDVVSRAFLIITVAAVAFCFIFTIIATARSISGMTLENKNPISHVLKNALKACVSFMLVPFLCIFMLQISSVLTRQAQTALLNQNGMAQKASTGTYIFLTASLRAGKKPMAGQSYVTFKYLEPDMGDELRLDYLNKRKNYLDRGDSGVDFSIIKIDYLLGYVASIFMIALFIGLIVHFIRRMLELMMLYLVSPFFVATIPVDDGAMFKKWRERFIIKFLSGFAVIFALKLFLLLLPTIFSNKLDLGTAVLGNQDTIIGSMEKVADQAGLPKLPEEGFTYDDLEQALTSLPGMSEASDIGIYNSISNGISSFAFERFGIGEGAGPTTEASLIDSVLKLAFLMGGTWAVFKSRTLVLEILSPEEARSTRASTATGVRVMAKTAKLGYDIAKTGVDIGVGIGLGAMTAGAGTAAAAGAKAGAAGAKAGAAGMKKGAEAGANAGKKAKAQIKRKAIDLAHKSGSRIGDQTMNKAGDTGREDVDGE